MSITDPAPFYMVVEGLTPTLTWVYPDESCHPDHYQITIYDQDVARWPNDFARFPPTSVYESQTAADETYFNVPASVGLLPGQTYFVKVRPKTAEGRGDHFTIWWFSTGPTCTASTRLQPPTLLYPPDGRAVYFPDSINLEWENQMTCWPAGDFYLQISTTADFAAPIWYGTTHLDEFISISDGPPMFSDCTRYYWRVRPDPAGGGVGPYSEAWSFVLSWGEYFCPLEPVIIITREPIRIPPFAGVKTNASCRSGPSLDYPVLDYLAPGQSAPIEGRNEDSTWWYILSPNLNSQCWISGLVVDLSGDYSQAPLASYAHPPGPTDTEQPNSTDTPFNCAQFNNNPNTCEGQNECKWDSSVPPNGACVNK